MKSKRFEVLAARPVNQDGYVQEWPEVGLIAMNSPFDPKPSIKIENGVITEMDGKCRADFDMLDTFIADHAIRLGNAEKAMAMDLMKQIVEQVMAAMKNGTPASAPAAASSCGSKVTAANYPLAESMADQIKTPTGKDFTSLSYEKVINGELSADDMRIAPETLEMQAQVAESVHREAFAGNLRRAAELIAVPDDRLLEIYNALRPYRSTKQELLDIAGELDGKYGAKTAASLVREAAEVYEKRGRLKKF